MLDLGIRLDSSTGSEKRELLPMVACACCKSGRGGTNGAVGAGGGIGVPYATGISGSSVVISCLVLATELGEWKYLEL